MSIQFINNDFFIGSIDQFDNYGIGGWIYDKINKKNPALSIYIDEKFIREVTPNTVRDDLSDFPDIETGFFYRFPPEFRDGQMHSIHINSSKNDIVIFKELIRRIYPVAGQDKFIDNDNFIGSIDQLDSQGIGGWIYDKLNNIPPALSIFIDEKLTREITPNLVRQDLLDFPDIVTGFFYRFPPEFRDSQMHSIHINSSKNYIPIFKKFILKIYPIVGQEKFIDNDNFIGTIDQLDNEGIGGWIYDKLNNIPPALSIYIDDKLLHEMTPNIIRTDQLDSLDIATAGFFYRFPPDLRDGQSHNIRISSSNKDSVIFNLRIKILPIAEQEENIPNSNSVAIETPNILGDRSIYNNIDPLLQIDLQGWGSDADVFHKLIDEIKPKKIIEVGTWKGLSAITMGYYIKSKKLNCKIICVDTWLGSCEFWEKGAGVERDLLLKNGYPQVYYQFISNVARCHLEDFITPFPATSAIASKYFRRNNIKADLIYIDASHDYVDILLDISNYFPLLSDNGIIFGDDYSNYWPDVKKAVNEFSQKHNYTLEIINEKWIIRK